MKIIQNILTKNDCYKTNRTIKVKGLMLHSVGCSQPSASVFVNSWNRSGVAACVHAFIDANNGTVYQTLPWNHRGWHGGGKSNNTHIGVEMCEPSTIKYSGGATFKDTDPVATKKAVLRTYNAAVELFAYLCKEYDLNPLTDIVSHREGHALGIATNHGDPEHLWSKFSLTMDGFRKAVQAQMGQGDVVTPPKTESAVTGDSVVSYKVRVTASALNIRSGAGTNHKIVGCIRDKGVYTIVDEDGSWGKLKSGAGWISLNYTKKV
jgi:hypothetical protein